jgi:hypothetical protein
MSLQYAQQARWQMVSASLSQLNPTWLLAVADDVEMEHGRPV